MPRSATLALGERYPMYVLDACLVCGSSERTIVAEYNRLIVVDWMWQNELARYDYALCHGCGIVYATRRPNHEEYEFLYEHFNEFLKRTVTEQTNIFNYPGPLTPDIVRELQSALVPWWELRNANIAENDRVVEPLRWEFHDMLGDLPVLIRHGELSGSKILQIRAKSGAFADLLMRVFGAAQVDVISLFPVCEYVAKEVYGLRAKSCLDYENFSVPFDEVYDLILANHMLVHCLDYASMFATINDHLTADGWLFIRKELDDTLLFQRGKNLFAELRPFHFQQFDVPVLERILRRFGFIPHELRQKDIKRPEVIGIAARSERQDFDPIAKEELEARLALYREWRDESLISLPPDRAAALFGDEVEQARARLTARNAFKLDKTGKPRVPRPLRFDDDALPDASVKQQSLVAAQ